MLLLKTFESSLSLQVFLRAYWAEKVSLTTIQKRNQLHLHTGMSRESLK